MGFGKDGRGVIVHEQQTLALLALDGQDVISTNDAVQMDSDFRILKSVITVVITGLTSTEGNGLLLYMTEGDLDDALIEANIELNGPQAPGDPDNEEVASRWVRLVATSDNNDIPTERMMVNEKGGSIIEFTPRWTFRRRRTVGQGGWNWSMYNNGVTITTGAVARIFATHYGVWVA